MVSRPVSAKIYGEATGCSRFAPIGKRSLDLLRGVVDLSRPLGLSVTIEGVETFEQLKLLALDVKPDLVQGFLFGSALTGAGIETMSNTVWPFAKDIRLARVSGD